MRHAAACALCAGAAVVALTAASARPSPPPPPPSHSSWLRFHGSSQAELVAQLRKDGVIRSERVAAVMGAVDRREFDLSGRPYEDAPQGIGFGATISAPHMHAYALEALNAQLARREQRGLGPARRALDVGCGSGYLSVCLALLLGPGAETLGVDAVPQLVAMSEANTRKSFARLLDSHALRFLRWNAANARAGEDELGAPFDIIHVGFALPDPKQLLGMLARGGTMVAPINRARGAEGQDFIVFTKDAREGKEVEEQRLLGCVFVPMIPPDRPPAAAAEREAALRRELEAESARLRDWERAFASERGRAPTAEEAAAAPPAVARARIAQALEKLAAGADK
jgi:protein-L-isoaspartate(D-aspartate) O-methyltransferase